MTHALIIGGGPGGLAAAVALERVGIRATIYERTPEVRTAGSGLTLWPNAFKALEYLGVDQTLAGVCAFLDGIAMRSWRGKLLSATPGRATDRLCGISGATAHRMELIRVLLDRVGREAVQLGARCIGFREHAAGVTALFADGRRAEGDLLIGADGLRSAIAGQLFGSLALRYAGYSVWRGVARFTLPEEAGLMSLGPGAQFGMFPMTEGRVYWFAALGTPEGSVRQSDRHKPTLLARFGTWHAPIPALIETTEDHAILATDAYDRPPLQRWGRGRVTLLGDAAHPSEPTLGQGACQALEDAVVLGACLQAADDVPVALRAYEARRIPRANAVTAQAHRMGRLGQWQRWPLPWIRECVIRLTPPWVQLRHLRWLWDFSL